MAEEKTNTEAQPASIANTQEPTVILAQEGETAPEQKISELDRAQLSEAWNETAAIRNALVALQADHKRLQAEQRTIEAESKIQELLGQQAQQVFNSKMQEIRQTYNIPDGYQIDAKTGLVSEAPPEQPQQTGQPQQ